jgi:hypothetical protein
MEFIKGKKEPYNHVTHKQERQVLESQRIRFDRSVIQKLLELKYNTIGMNPYPTNINLRMKSIKKTPQGQLYLDKLNLFLVLIKRKLLHHSKHNFIQNIMVKSQLKYKLNNIIYNR